MKNTPQSRVARSQSMLCRAMAAHLEKRQDAMRRETELTIIVNPQQVIVRKGGK